MLVLLHVIHEGAIESNHSMANRHQQYNSSNLQHHAVTATEVLSDLNHDMLRLVSSVSAVNSPTAS